MDCISPQTEEVAGPQGPGAETVLRLGLGARNLFCLSGDPIHVGDHADAKVVGDLDVTQSIALARRMREQGTTLAGVEVADPPRFLIGSRTFRSPTPTTRPSWKGNSTPAPTS